MDSTDLTMTKTPKSNTDPNVVDIRSFHTGRVDAKAFRSLDEEWITKFFTMESRDFEILSDPEAAILRNATPSLLINRTTGEEFGHNELASAHDELERVRNQDETAR
jgi:hypothetical protein